MGRLADEIEEEQRARGPARGRRCTVGLYLEGLSPEDREDLEAGLAADRSQLTTAAIYAVLERQEGTPPPGVGTLDRHRSGRCACGRRAR